jgi:hypothetical protein
VSPLFSKKEKDRRPISKTNDQPDLVVITPVIPSTRKTEVGRIMVRSQSGQKVHETPSQPIAGCSGIVPIMPAIARNIK